MDLNIENNTFVVCGASSGFGFAVAQQLLNEGAKTILVARRTDAFEKLKSKFPDRLEFVAGDISQNETLDLLLGQIGDRFLSGLFVNAGGPPAKSVQETEMEDWDNAYRLLLRWKIKLVKALLPKLIDQNYGRIVFLESISVKQPVENLVLSTSLRLAVVGFAKSLALEIAKHGITVNVLAPGYHATDAMQRLFKKRAEMSGVSIEAAQASFEKEIPVGSMGTADELASLALWLLSPVSRYITGQTFSLDGGTNKSIFG
jgi:3-oxoacyl-[acyl-carrier protein] reductase